MEFEWDENKNQINIKKHKVSFDEAKTAFYDDDGLLISDPDHSDEEDRFILLGKSSKLHLLMVCHCYRDDDEKIRLISARKATTREKKQYQERGGVL